MVFISLNPFYPKKALLLLAASFALVCSCFADSTFFTVKSTPYDSQMTRIRPFLASAGARNESGVSMGLVNQWMGNLRSIPYGFSQEWKTPSEVETGSAADCKGKAVALYERMQAHGASNMRLVIGKRTSSSRMTHAWLEWDTKNGSYVLDPTINWMACKSEELGSKSYVPLYAYAGARKFRAAGATTLVAQN